MFQALNEDMWLYLSEKEKFNDFGNEDALVWHETNVPYAVWEPSSTRCYSLQYFPSEAVKNNGSLYAHVFFARSGYPPDPNDPEYQAGATFGRAHPVVAYLRKSKADKKKSLLGNSKGPEEEQPAPEVEDDKKNEAKDEGPVEWVSYWKPNVTINLVDDFTRYLTGMVERMLLTFLVAICQIYFWRMRTYQGDREDRLMSSD